MVSKSQLTGVFFLPCFFSTVGEKLTKKLGLRMYPYIAGRTQVQMVLVVGLSKQWLLLLHIPLTSLFNLSLATGEVTQQWKTSFQRRLKNRGKNRPISFLNYIRIKPSLYQGGVTSPSWNFPCRHKTTTTTTTKQTNKTKQNKKQNKTKPNKQTKHNKKET